MATIQFFGAARTVTGSKHVFTTKKGYQILLDCGMYQGRRENKEQDNWHFGFTPSKIDALILSHAHIDHSGLIPMLVKHGFKGKIFATSATYDLCKLLLYDSAHIQEQDLYYVNKNRRKKDLPPIAPLYNKDDVAAALSLFECVNYHEKFTVCNEVEAYFNDAGHILGSASVYLLVNENGNRIRFCYSGDLGRKNTPIIRSPEPLDACDYLIIESTYGSRLHDNVENSIDKLRSIIEDTCVKKKGKLIIPAFSVGRTQELLYSLDQLSNHGKLPNIPVYLDSPLSQNATAVIKTHKNILNDKIIQYLKNHDDNADPFGFSKLHYITNKEESQALNFQKQPCIIISASGMAEAGRVKHHIKNSLSDARNTILFVGHCEQSTLGARLLSGDQAVKIFGEYYDVKASVLKLEGMSAHADQNELTDWIFSNSSNKFKKIFLVHGDYDTQIDFSNHLQNAGLNQIEIPDFKEIFEIQ